MEWIIILLIGVWYVFRQWQKHTPEAEMQKLEEVAYGKYYKVLEIAKKSLTRYEDNKKAGKYLMGKEQNEDMIKMAKKSVDEIEEVESIFVRLKERYIHKPAKERLELYLDFYNFVTNLNRLDSRSEQLNYDFSENAYEDFEEDIKEPRIQNEEIVKRFKEKVK